MSKPIVKIVHNPVVAKIITEDDDIRHQVSEILSYKVEGSEHMNMSSWDGYTSLFVMKNNQFPAGMVRLVKRRLERSGVRVIVKSAPAPAPQGEENPKVDDFPEDPRYDYQPELMRRLVSLKGMIAQVATGGGKSRCFKLCERRLALPTLFVTTRKSLMYQMADAYKNDLGLPVGLLGDDHWSPIKDGANFAIVDTLVSRLEVFDVDREIERRLTANAEVIDKEVEEELEKVGLPTNFRTINKSRLPAKVKQAYEKIRSAVEKRHPIDEAKMQRELKAKQKKQAARRKETLELLKGIGFLCLEEAHEVSGDGFFDLTKACVNAHYRLALTATPFMKDDEEANMKLMAATGPVGITVSEELLIERGILAKPYFKFIEPVKPLKLYRSTKWQSAYTIGIVESADRNKKIIKEVYRAKQYGLTSMILVGRQSHGKILKLMFDRVGIRSKFIYGDHKQEQRKKALMQLGNGEIDCLIGSTILDVGVDVPSVGLVGLAGGGKAEVAVRQRIGRGLRAKKSGPNVCFIFDFTDPDNSTLKRHANERRRIIESTPGFVEGIVSDFDYEKLGFSRLPKVS